MTRALCVKMLKKIEFYKWSCKLNGRGYEQEAQLSQRDRTTLGVIKYFAKSLKVIRNDTLEYGVCKSLSVFHWNYIILYLVPFPRYSGSNNGVTLKLRVRVVGNGAVQFITTYYWPALSNYSSILYHFRVFWRWITPIKSGLMVIQGHWK